MSSGRQESVIKWFDAEKAYGFLETRSVGERDVFVHMRQLRESGVTGQIEPGQRFSFEVADGKKGRYAINLKRV